MASVFVYLLTSCILVLGSSLHSECSLLIDPASLTVTVDGQSSFTFISDSKFTEDVKLKFNISFPDIIRIEPMEFVIPANFSAKYERNITVYALSAGHVEVFANPSPPIKNVDGAYIKVDSENSPAISITSITVGWIYFAVWSISFYPQMYENWKRKSVVGLNFDFLTLNLTGFSLYALFNCGLFWIPAIKDQFFERYPHSAIPVQPNDIFFAVHAVAVTLVTILQCFIYERGGQTVSMTAKGIQGIFFLFLLISMLCSVFNVLSWLDFLYYCSYVKLTITLIKYVPQAYMNYKRKSTVGWSIGNILCDFTGGLLSVLQMVLDAYNFDDWASIFGSPTKFGLGFFSVLFDIFFIIQHYILYRDDHSLHSGYERLEGHNSPEASTETLPQDLPSEEQGPQGPQRELLSSDSVT